MEWPRAEDLLAGPRGRRLCWSLLNPGDYPGWDLVWDGAHRGNLTGLTDELAACVARTDLDSTVVHAGPLTLLAALVEPVGTAMYWQEPDDDDYALSAREVRDARSWQLQDLPPTGWTWMTGHSAGPSATQVRESPKERDCSQPCLGYLRSDLNPARTSSEKSCGCSQAAKCPPLSTSLK